MLWNEGTVVSLSAMPQPPRPSIRASLEETSPPRLVNEKGLCAQAAPAAASTTAATSSVNGMRQRLFAFVVVIIPRLPRCRIRNR